MRRHGESRALIDVRLTPRAARAGLAMDGELVRARVTAPPLDGRANDALIELLASRLGVSKRDITLVSGQRSRMKRVAVAGVNRAEALVRLAAGDQAE